MRAFPIFPSDIARRWEGNEGMETPEKELRNVMEC
jgi:hypothetical protein